MNPAEENRFYELERKQKKVALDSRELKELLRLTHQKAKETAALNERKRLN
jgi:hypothetical protein